MTSKIHALAWAFVVFLGCAAAQADSPTILETGYVFPSFAVADAAGPVPASAVVLSLTGEPATGTRGRLVFRDCSLNCNAFGDLVPEGPMRESVHEVALEAIEVSDPEGWSRKLFVIRFDDGRFSNRIYVATSGHPALPHKLLVLAPSSGPISPQGKLNEHDLRHTYAFDCVLPLVSKEPPPAEFDAPMTSFLLTSRPYWTDRVPSYRTVRIEITGAPATEGGIVLDGNGFSLEAFGDGGMSTLMAYGSRPVRFEELSRADPTGHGRRSFTLATLPMGKRPPITDGLQFTLVVAPDSLGPHRLIVRRDDELLCVLPLADREYVPHLRILQGLNDEREQAAANQLYKRFRGQMHLQTKNAHVTLLDVRVDTLKPGELNSLVDLPGLRDFYLHSKEPMDGARLAILPRLKELATLALRGNAVAPEILEQLSGLNSLVLEGYDSSPTPRPPLMLTRRSLTAIGKMNKLNHLSLSSLELEADSLHLLEPLRSLKSLGMHNTPVAVKALVKMNRALPDTEIDTSDCQLFPATHTALLRGINVKDVDLSALAEVPWLEVLLVDSCENITDASAKKIGGLKNLAEIQLRSLAQISDEGIVGWSGLTKLRRLTLACPLLTDRTVDELIGLANLEQLDLSGTAVTPQGLELLRQELPNCKVYPE